jgi:Glucose-6-phosphate dehydrogenase, C-terminal domain
VAETVGVEQRGAFYEATRALRDMVPNHILSLLSLVAMEPPVGFDAASVRTKKVEVFAAMPTATAKRRAPHRGIRISAPEPVITRTNRRKSPRSVLHYARFSGINPSIR